ncbi:MAG: DUF6265 family protein [Candidatus Acidiferrales bacterium]|jgi:hypothetical protein
MTEISRRMIVALLFGTLPALSPCLPAQQQAANPEIAEMQTASPSLADFSWLEGAWRGEWGPRTAEQVWLAPKAGETLGIFRLVENEKTLVIELFTLVQNSNGIDFYLRHFTPQLIPWEKSDATLLHLASHGDTRFEFENPANGMPKRAILTRLDADTFVARSEIIPESGEIQVVEITYHRQNSAAEKPNAGNAAHRKKP